MKEDLFYILIKLLSVNDIRINQEELNLQLLSHPSYPSLHSLTGVLNHFNIQNVALEVPVESAMLEQLPHSFIAHVISEEEDFVLVEKTAGGFLTHYGKNNKKTISQIEFLDIWDGVILLVEKDTSFKKDSKPAFLNRTIAILIALLCIFLTFFVYDNFSLFSFLHFILSLGGLYFSIAIIKHELGLTSAVSEKICNFSEQTSCDEVLNSKGGQLFGFLKLSEISLVTFSTYILTWLLLFLTNSSNVTELVSITLFSIPIVLYSLFYQYFIVGKWCPLCLGIATILGLQAALVILVDFQFFSFDLKNTLLFLISLLTSTLVASFLLPMIRKKTALEKLEIEHYQFKRKFSLFDAIYSNNKRLEMIAPIEGEIILGESEAPLKLIIVTNPFCYYCKQMHSDLENFLNNDANNIQVIIRFNVDPNNKDHKTYRLTSILLDIYNREGSEKLMNALQEVFAEKVDLEKWMSQKEAPQTSYEKILTDQRRWCQANGINFTPVMVVNERRYPQEYDKGDLIYFIDELIEQIDEGE